MKVALVGNMNNNFFSLMRLLRDKGIDAYLLLFVNEISHFLPECDTWEIEKWKPYIIQTNLHNGDISKYLCQTKKDIQQYLSGYDVYIGTGFTPAIFFKAGYTLDYFFPYSIGIEYVHMRDIKKTNVRNLLKHKIYSYFQLKGLKHNTLWGVTIESKCQNVFADLGVKYHKLGLPMVYEEQNTQDEWIKQNSKIIERMTNSYPVLFSHVSHIYADSNYIFKDLKRNYLLIEGFAAFLKTCKSNKPLMVLLDYGVDVPKSKELIRHLGIEEYVLWIPKMFRKEIMYLLNYVDIGGSELGGSIWGGVGWEFMVKSVPFMHHIDADHKNNFEDRINAPLPPIYNVSTIDEIRDCLLEIENMPKLNKEKGKELNIWYEKYFGDGLINHLIELLKKK